MNSSLTPLGPLVGKLADDRSRPASCVILNRALLHSAAREVAVQLWRLCRQFSAEWGRIGSDIGAGDRDRRQA